MICSVLCFNICNCQHYVDVYKWTEKADAQSPMDMMDMMMSDTGDNMSLPFNMDVLAMPMMCTTPNQLLGSLTGMMFAF